MNDKYGINIKEYCRNHEKKIAAAIDSGFVTEEIIELHIFFPGKHPAALVPSFGVHGVSRC